MTLLINKVMIANNEMIRCKAVSASKNYQAFIFSKRGI